MQFKYIWNIQEICLSRLKWEVYFLKWSANFKKYINSRNRCVFCSDLKLWGLCRWVFQGSSGPPIAGYIWGNGNICRGWGKGLPAEILLWMRKWCYPWFCRGIIDRDGEPVPLKCLLQDQSCFWLGLTQGKENPTVCQDRLWMLWGTIHGIAYRHWS